MGFAELFGSVANIYNKVKSTVSEIYNAGKSITHKVREGWDWFDQQLDKASNIPFIGTAIGEAVDYLRDFGVGGVSYNSLKRHVDKWDNYLQSGVVDSYGQMIDDLASNVISEGEKFGNITDQVFGSGGQTAGGMMF